MTTSGDNTNVFEGIDACRPGSDDIHLPELSHVAEAIAADEELKDSYSSVQRSDSAMAEAFHDVGTPPGLQDRLLAALAEEKPEAKSSEKSLVSRRTLVGGALAASLLLALGVGLSIWSQPSPATLEAWVAAADVLQGELNAGVWEDMESAPVERPATNQLHRQVNFANWKPVKHQFDRNAVAYRLVRGGANATLFVFQPETIDSSLPLAPTIVPAKKSSQSATGVWTSNDLVYVLVVDRPGKYEDFLNGGAIAKIFVLLRSLA